MSTTLCEWSKKDIERREDELKALLANPTFYCRKCARCACTAAVLCKPKRLQRPEAILEEARRALARAS